MHAIQISTHLSQTTQPSTSRITTVINPNVCGISKLIKPTRQFYFPILSNSAKFTIKNRLTTLILCWVFKFIWLFLGCLRLHVRVYRTLFLIIKLRLMMMVLGLVCERWAATFRAPCPAHVFISTWLRTHLCRYVFIVLIKVRKFKFRIFITKRTVHPLIQLSTNI